MKNAIAYLRVSTDGQVGEDKYGIEAQKVDIVNFAYKNNIHIVDWYYDEGVSGGKLDRPALNRIIEGDFGKDVSTIIVAKTDRLSRDIQLYYYIKLTLTKKGLELVSVQEDWGSYGMMAPMFESMVVAFAEFERQMIKSRTTKGRNVKASKGGYAGGKPPYGYNTVEGKLVIDEDEADVVRMIFTLKESGYSLRGIVSELEGIKTRTGKNFYASTIGYIIRNEEMYRGLYKYSEMEDFINGNHEPILV